MTVDEPPKEIVIQNVTVQSPTNKRFTIPIMIETTERKTEEAHALIDCGAEGLFVDTSYAKQWRKEPLKHQIRVRNVDGTINANGNIKEKCLITFRIGDEEMTEWFHVTNTGDQNLILGLPWLTKRNPIIDWRGKSLEIRTSTGDSNWRESEVTAKIRGPQGKPEVNNSWPAMDEDLYYDPLLTNLRHRGLRSIFKQVISNISSTFH